MKTKIINGVEYECETHDFDTRLSEIKIPKGWRLWTAQECFVLHSKHRQKLNLNECWFFIQQPFSFNIEKGLVAGFDADSDRAFLDCDRYPDNRYGALGVRFCRDVKKVKT